MCPRYEGKPIQDMARWSGWGAVPEVFDEARDEHFWALGHLRLYLTDQEYIAAQRSTLSAHYTDAAIVQAIWEGVRQFGFTGGQVLEPGCGSGNFIAFAPPGAVMTGVEMEPVTAGIAAALYPDARILVESFADTRIPEGSFDLVIGNVPFGNITLTDRRHNPGRRSIHNHFIKSLALTRPGGIVALLTSRFTMDARNPAARREIAGLADLVAAVRLPSGAHQRAAGTKVVTDLLILRRREPDSHLRGAAWEQACMVTVPTGSWGWNWTGLGATPAGDAARDLLDLSRPELDSASQAARMGVPASRATTAEEFARQLARALAEPGPHLIEAVVPPIG